MPTDQENIDYIVERLLQGCPHAGGCESHCPLAQIRQAEDPRAELEKQLEANEIDPVDVIQVHLLCPRNKTSCR